MAAKRPPSALQPPVVDQVLSIPVADIAVGERLRPVDPLHAQGLAALMDRDGQDTPIEVCRLPGQRTWMLVTGGHRLAAAKHIGWTHIRALVVTADSLERRRKEVSENLFHSELNPIDRSAFVAELYNILRLKSGVDPAATPQQIAVNARWQKELKTQADDTGVKMTLVYGWTEQVAGQLGLSHSTIKRDLLLHRRLPAALIARLRGLPLASNAAQLRALAKLDEAMQRQVVDLITGGKSKSVPEAIKRLRGTKAPGSLDPQDLYYDRITKLWSRLSAKSRRLVIEELIGKDHRMPARVRDRARNLYHGVTDGEVDVLYDGAIGGPLVRVGAPSGDQVLDRPVPGSGGLGEGPLVLGGGAGSPTAGSDGSAIGPAIGAALRPVQTYARPSTAKAKPGPLGKTKPPRGRRLPNVPDEAPGDD